MRRHVCVVSTSFAGPRQDSNTRRDIHGVGARAPDHQLPGEVVSGGEFCARLEAVVSVGE